MQTEKTVTRRKLLFEKKKAARSCYFEKSCGHERNWKGMGVAPKKPKK